ncbi:MAG: ATP synthase F1 subunit delta [bacterium]|nr:ATP synthase F1 subunit delta [bacterium]
MANISHNDIAKAIYMSVKDKTGGQLATSLQDVVKFLARKRLLSKSPAILSSLEKIFNQEEKIIKAKVISVKKLHNETKTHLIHKLEKRYNAHKVFLEEFLDEKLLGGIRIEVEDEVIDLSMKNKINKLQEHLIKNT